MRRSPGEEDAEGLLNRRRRGERRDRGNQRSSEAAARRRPGNWSDGSFKVEIQSSRGTKERCKFEITPLRAPRGAAWGLELEPRSTPYSVPTYRAAGTKHWAMTGSFHHPARHHPRTELQLPFLFVRAEPWRGSYLASAPWELHWDHWGHWELPLGVPCIRL